MKHPLALLLFFCAYSHGISVTQLHEPKEVPWLLLVASVLIVVLSCALVYLYLINRRLLKAKYKLHILWRNIPDVLLEVDSEGNIFAINKAFSDDIPMESVIGCSCYDFLSKSDQALFRHHLQNALHTGQTEQYELHSQKYLKGGSYRQQIVPFYLEDEMRALVITSDVSEHKEAERILKQARQQAEENTKSKVQFISKMSHEVRTPLEAINNMVDLIEDVYQSDEMRQYSQPLKTSVKHLQRIMEDIKTSARTNSDDVHLEQTDTSLWNMLDDLEALYSTQAHNKGLRLRMFVTADVPRVVNVDGFRLRQVMYNLLNNAVKFTQQGRIDVSLSHTHVGGQSLIKVTIKDTGQGVEKARISELFEAQPSDAHYGSGSGLGLSICRDLVQAMGGVIGVESIETQGSEFWFTFLMNAAKHADPELKWSKDYIYVALKDEQKQVWFLHFFKCLSLPVRLIEGLEELEAADSSLLVSDHLQTDACGWLWWLGIDYELTEISAVVLNMPYRREALYQRLKAYTSHNEVDSNTASSAHKEPKSMNTLADQGPLLLVEDNLTNQLVIRKTLEKLGYNVDIANNGQEGVEAYQQKSYMAVIMDIQMPVMDGIEATKRIRQLAGVHTPIIALTANTQNEIEEACFAAGMDAYLNKPVDRQVLQNTLQDLLISTH